MTLEQRNRAIADFTHNPEVVVFLMSLKAGGVALNLTAASHVMIMDPWWNPAVEQQVSGGPADDWCPARSGAFAGGLEGCVGTSFAWVGTS
jgi:hypothetical protein